MSALRAVGSFFLAPGAAAEPPTHPDAPAVARAGEVAVLCRGADAWVAGAAVGLALAHERRARCVLVAVHRPGGEERLRAVPAAPAAARLARTLDRRGHACRAVGRAVLAPLPADGAEAATAARRMAAAAGEHPVVTVLGGPRCSALDELLGEQRLVVVATRAGANPALARLAVAELRDAGIPARTCEVPAGAAARALAGAGVGLLPSLRQAVAGVWA